MNFCEYSNDFLGYVECRLKASTIRQYRYVIQKYLIPEFGQCEIHEITRAAVVMLHNQMRDTPFLANRTLAVGRRMYNYAALIGEVEKHPNPFSGVAFYKEHMRDRHLSPHEYKCLHRTLGEMEKENLVSEYALAGIRFLILTGCRASEAQNLMWNEVDLDQRLIFLSDSKTGPRTLDLPEEVVKILSSLTRTCDRVFPGRYCMKIKLWSVWTEVRKRAGIEDVRLHDLRHSYATTAVNEQIPLPVIARLLGHSKVWTTTRYLHASRAQTAVAAGKLANVISNS